jgi:hypothetical protein
MWKKGILLEQKTTGATRWRKIYFDAGYLISLKPNLVIALNFPNFCLAKARNSSERTRFTAARRSNQSV